MTKRITALAIALLLANGACKRREEVTAPATPVTVPTVVPTATLDVPPVLAAPVAVVDAGPTVPGPNAIPQPGAVDPNAPAPGTLAPGAAPPTGAPPAAPVAAADVPAAAPAAPAAPTAARPRADAGQPVQIRIPGLANQPINIDQRHGQTRVNVGGVQVVIPGVN